MPQSFIPEHFYGKGYRSSVVLVLVLVLENTTFSESFLSILIVGERTNGFENEDDFEDEYEGRARVRFRPAHFFMATRNPQPATRKV